MERVVNGVRSVGLAFLDFFAGDGVGSAAAEAATGRGSTKIWDRVWRARCGGAGCLEASRESEMMGDERGMVDLSRGSWGNEGSSQTEADRSDSAIVTTTTEPSSAPWTGRIWVMAVECPPGKVDRTEVEVVEERETRWIEWDPIRMDGDVELALVEAGGNASAEIGVVGNEAGTGKVWCVEVRVTGFEKREMDGLGLAGVGRDDKASPPRGEAADE